MKRRTILIVGGALAGPTAAARAREVDEDARIVLLERAGHVSYPVAALANHLSGEVSSIAAMDRERAEFFRDVYDVEVRKGTEARRIDPRAKKLHTDSDVLPYDSLIVATGAKSIVPDVPALEGASNVTLFRNLAHLKHVMTALKRARSVAIIGGGFFGVEAADGLGRRGGVGVVLIERQQRILGGFAPGAALAARGALGGLGVDVREGVSIARAERRGDRVTALVPDVGPPIPCDLVIIAAGVRPRTGLLAQAGARTLESGAVRIDERCATSLPDVYACGSCVAVEHWISGLPVWIPQAAMADKTAQVAGSAAAGGDHRLYRPALGTSIVRAGAMVVGRIGLPRADVQNADLVRVHPTSHEGYFPGATPLSVEIATEPVTGRILAADVWGQQAVDRTLDMIAMAMIGQVSLHDLEHVDFAYAPPFGAARDALNVAGGVAADLRDAGPIAWSPAEVARTPGAVLVDVRSPAERRDLGAITGATMLSLAALRASSKELAKSTGPLVFVSSDGRAGYLAARIGRARGLGDSGYLSGGVRSWIDEGFPVERAAPRAPRPTAKKKQGTR